MSNHKIALRALEDREFAQKILAGEEDYPDVRDAILADFFELADRATELSGEKLRFAPRFVDAGPRFGPMGPCYVKYYPKMPAPDAWREWAELPRHNLKRIARVRVSPAVAARYALEDHEFAQRVLTGEEDYPEVRDAILADLFESTEQATGREAGEPKFATRFVDAGPRFGPMGPCYVKYYPKMPAPDAWTQWVALPRENLKRIVATSGD